ncbi:AMP-binding protein [Nocardioides terrisoli]|uniref:AMP-binding protein n=1 Tax=Nocardioides terrisoli TaxID=3388267 RepID=UPI00287B80C3|nr:AMP-binding protein [Nocardioides marmorisolisilvae]
MKPVGDRRSIHIAMHDAVLRMPGAPLVTFTVDPERTYTRADFWELSMRSAAALVSSGTKAGDRVVIMTSNRIEFLATWTGAVAIGAIPAPLNTSFKGHILRNMLALVDPVVVIAEGEVLTHLAPQLVAIDFSGTLVAVDGVRTLPPATQGVGSSQCLYADWANVAPLQEFVLTRPSDPGLILYTSGTTGASKAVLWPHNMLISFSETVVEIMDYQPGDVLYTALPLFHGNALIYGFYAALLCDATSVIAPRFSPSTFWDDMRRWGVTKTSMMGQMAAMLHGKDCDPRDPENPVERIWITPPPADSADFETRFDVRLAQGYGLTDVGLPLGSPRDLNYPMESVGRVNPGWEVIVADDHDQPVGIGETGELLVRPLLPYTTPIGYWRNAEATMELTRNLWYHTGDSLCRDEDGWFYYLGRKKDSIRRGGENIAPDEVEMVLALHPAIAEVGAFAVPSDLTEDDVMVALILHFDDVDLEEIGDFAEENLPFYAVPRYYDVRSDLPRTATHKVRREALRKTGVTPTTWDRGRTKRTQSVTENR